MTHRKTCPSADGSTSSASTLGRPRTAVLYPRSYGPTEQTAGIYTFQILVGSDSILPIPESTLRIVHHFGRNTELFKHFHESFGLSKKSKRSDLWFRTIFLLDKGAKNSQWGKNSLFNRRCWGNWRSICEKMKFGPLSHTIYKIN